MPRRRRSEVIREDEVGVYHVWVRCVRRAWLCGLDPLTGNDYEYRKGWIESRLAELARIFAIDTCVYAATRISIAVRSLLRPGEPVPDEGRKPLLRCLSGPVLATVRGR